MAVYRSDKKSKSGKDVAKDLLWFFLRATGHTLHTVLMDNKIIDKWKKENRSAKDSDSGFEQFFINLKRTYPKNAARLKLWMLYGLIIVMMTGGVKITHRNQDDKKAEQELVVSDKKDVVNNFAKFKENLKHVTPWLISELIAAEGVEFDANGLHKPYKDGNGIWTIGYGSTILKDGSRVCSRTPHMTDEEAYDLARWHIEDGETFFMLYCYCAYDNNLAPKTTGEAFGLLSILYNSGTKFIEDKDDNNCRQRFETLRQMYKEYGDSITDDMVKDVFKKYPIQKKNDFGSAWMDSHSSDAMAQAIGKYMKDGAGMHWRRWLEAGLITGDINPEDLLNCPIKGMSDFYFYMGGYQEYEPSYRESAKIIKQKDLDLKKTSLWQDTPKGWIPKESTYKDFEDWLQNPKTKSRKIGQEGSIADRKKVRDFLPKEVLETCMQGKCEIGNFYKSNKNKTVAFFDGIAKIKNMQNNNNGQSFFDARYLS